MRRNEPRITLASVLTVSVFAKYVTVGACPRA
jgi:hypothetical protein